MTAVATDTRRDAGAAAVRTVFPACPAKAAAAVADAVIAACVPEAAAYADLVAEHDELQRRVEDLRAFEREYRARLKHYIRIQLQEISR